MTIAEKVLELIASASSSSIASVGVEYLEDSIAMLLSRISNPAAPQATSAPPMTFAQKQLIQEQLIKDQWNQPQKGYYEHTLPHPVQDPQFPFFYDPSTDEYIGFRWDYGDIGVIVPPLTPEVLQGLGGLYIAARPDDYYCTHGTQWHRRLTIIFFKKPQVYYTVNASHSPGNRLLQHAPLVAQREGDGTYWDVNLHPNANSLKDVGYGGLYSPGSDFGHGELFLFDPKTQVTRTIWYEWKPN